MLKIIGNKIHIKPILPSERVGSIFIPEKFRNHDPKQACQYRVLGVGRGRLLKNGNFVPIEIQPGDIVLGSLYMDHQTLEDGSKIVDVSQIEASWRE